MKQSLYIIPQAIIYFLLRPLSYVLFRKKSLVLLEKLYAKQNYIIAANHQSKLDPLVICASLPFAVFFKLAPFRFITANKYLSLWWLKPFLLIFGCYPAKTGEGQKSSIDNSAKLSGEGYTIFIFPEGIRTLPGGVEPRSGISIIAQKTGAQILPVLINWKRKSFLDRRFTVIIGQPLSNKGRPAKEIMNHIYDLGANSI